MANAQHLNKPCIGHNMLPTQLEVIAALAGAGVDARTQDDHVVDVTMGKSRMHTIVRVRPSDRRVDAIEKASRKEEDRPSNIILSYNSVKNQFHTEYRDGRNQLAPFPYAKGQVFDASADQQTFYDSAVRPHLQNMFSSLGGDAKGALPNTLNLVFSGASRSGKTYCSVGETIEAYIDYKAQQELSGDTAVDETMYRTQHAGVLPRILHEVHKTLGSSNSLAHFTVQIRSVQVRPSQGNQSGSNDSLNDLLAVGQAKVTIGGDNYVHGLSKVVIGSAVEAIALFESCYENDEYLEGLAKKLNFNKNRFLKYSHVCNIIEICDNSTVKQDDERDKKKNKALDRFPDDSGPTVKGRIVVVDLAPPLATSDHSENAASPNSTLQALHQCLRALASNGMQQSKNNHVPFRSATLTQVLARTLGCKNANTLLISCIDLDQNSNQKQNEMTLSVLRRSQELRGLLARSSKVENPKRTEAGSLGAEASAEKEQQPPKEVINAVSELSPPNTPPSLEVTNDTGEKDNLLESNIQSLISTNNILEEENSTLSKALDDLNAYISETKQKQTEQDEALHKRVLTMVKKHTQVVTDLQGKLKLQTEGSTNAVAKLKRAHEEILRKGEADRVNAIQQYSELLDLERINVSAKTQTIEKLSGQLSTLKASLVKEIEKKKTLKAALNESSTTIETVNSKFNELHEQYQNDMKAMQAKITDANNLREKDTTQVHSKLASLNNLLQGCKEKEVNDQRIQEDLSGALQESQALVDMMKTQYDNDMKQTLEQHRQDIAGLKSELRERTKHHDLLQQVMQKAETKRVAQNEIDRLAKEHFTVKLEELTIKCCREETENNKLNESKLHLEETLRNVQTEVKDLRHELEKMKTNHDMEKGKWDEKLREQEFNMLLRYDEDEEKRKQWLGKERIKLKGEYESDAVRLKIQFDHRVKAMRDEEERSHESAIIKLRRVVCEQYENEQKLLIEAHTQEMKRLRDTLDMISSKRSQTMVLRNRALPSHIRKDTSRDYTMPGDATAFTYAKGSNSEVPNVNEGPPELNKK